MSVRAVLLPVGEDLYAVAADRVCEVVGQPRPTRLPTAPATVLGVMNLRGDVVPLFDTAVLLGLGADQRVARPYAVVLQAELGSAAFVVDDLPRIAELAEHVGPSELPGTGGRYVVDGGIAVLLDLDRLLA